MPAKIPLEKKVHAHVVKNPGCRAESLTKALRCDPEETTRALKKLLDGGHLTKRGATRATTYTATMKALG